MKSIGRDGSATSMAGPNQRHKCFLKNQVQLFSCTARPDGAPYLNLDNEGSTYGTASPACAHHLGFDFSRYLPNAPTQVDVFPFDLPFLSSLSIRIELLPTGKASSYFCFVLQYVNTRHQIYIMYICTYIIHRYRICPFQESSIQNPRTPYSVLVI